ncbi:hypothetical protein SmJEL517_g00741 [Synchytrium microbalum]|uniref:TatD DNase family protein n=1 Tax=Synchytrium microbalum TaxID=1806994 RepID=A0A507CH99_9FUNG|nr:uncharacterized protein SmJEL517_g00741 [Synchytrium microbalum]TPX37446.1 hypothetical protein SmJEL517_g00741 [Synchytrium microbalum]
MPLLESFLIKLPNALVGEIGLDNVATDPTTKKKYRMDRQIDAFIKQMNLATRYNRPVSVHLVKCHGQFLDIMKAIQYDSIPKKIMLHSWTGSAEIAMELLKIPVVGPRLYFSLSHGVSARSPQFGRRIENLPIDRLLVESDVHDTLEVDNAIEKIVELIAGVRGMPLDDIVDVLVRNTESFSDM